MTNNKYDFIRELLNNNKLTISHKKRLLDLTISEIKSQNSVDKSLLNRIENIEDALKEFKNNTQPENCSNKDNPIDDKNVLTHNPKLVNRYLNKFKENTPLKWATHVWDENKFENIDSYIENLNEEKGHQELFKINRSLFNLINYFLYKPNNNPLENDMPKYGWRSGLKEMKIGWQFPNNLLVSWCKENYDNKSEADRKFPFQYILPEQLKPKRPVKGKMINTFENVVDIFKTEIQFRDNYLYRELKKRKSKLADFEFEGIEEFKNLDFYTYTRGFLSAIDRILDEVKRNETEKKLLFSYKIIENELFIDFTHFNSFPVRKLIRSNLNQFLGGGLNAISGSIFGLCDFSVVSKFIDQNNTIVNGELKIVYEGIKGNWSNNEILININPKLVDYNKSIKGFTYRFKFYL